MGTVAKDPMLLGRAESLTLPPKSNLPPGGSPETDAAYEKWLAHFVDTANLRWCDRHWPGVPQNEILKTYQLTGHLYRWIIGCSFPEGSGPNYLHRLRFVGVQYKLRPAEIHAEAHRYLVERIEAHNTRNGETR